MKWRDGIKYRTFRLQTLAITLASTDSVRYYIQRHTSHGDDSLQIELRVNGKEDCAGIWVHGVNNDDHTPWNGTREQVNYFLRNCAAREVFMIYFDMFHSMMDWLVEVNNET